MSKLAKDEWEISLRPIFRRHCLVTDHGGCVKLEYCTTEWTLETRILGENGGYANPERTVCRAPILAPVECWLVGVCAPGSSVLGLYDLHRMARWSRGGDKGQPVDLD